MINVRYASGARYTGLDECVSYARKDLLEKIYDNKHSVLSQLRRELEAFERLFKDQKSDEKRMRIRIIYYGRMFIILRENNCI